jgi:nicotinamide mononucleotide transporter
MDFSILASQIKAQDGLEWAGLITGILYVIFASHQRLVCWVFGIISSACIAWKSFTDYKLMADGLLQVFYIIVGFYGLYQWVTGRINERPKPVTVSSIKFHLIPVIVCLLISLPASWLLIHYASARYGYLDTALTLLSVFATFLLIRKDLHNWIYWIVIDIVYVVLYLKSEGLLFALLFLIYTIVSVWGFRQWRSTMMNLKVDR